MKKLSRKQWIIIAVVLLIGGAILRSLTNGGSDAPVDAATLAKKKHLLQRSPLMHHLTLVAVSS